jgi:hypothetical protein
LPEAQTALQRNRRLDQLNELSDSTALAVWAQSTLPLKNQLVAANARMLEAALAVRLEDKGKPCHSPKPIGRPRARNAKASPPQRPVRLRRQTQGRPKSAPTTDKVRKLNAASSATSPDPPRRCKARAGATPTVDKSALTFPGTPRSVHDREHLKFVAGQPLEQKRAAHLILNYRAAGPRK